MSSIIANELSASPEVFMFTAPNPGPKTLEGTHTYIVGHDAYVIDPGPDLPPYLEALAAWLRQTGRSPRGILLTHGHPDHAPGAARLKAILDVPVWSSARMLAEDSLRAGVDRVFEEDHVFAADDDILHVIPAPGHAFDHVCFWLPKAAILFAGDTILGQGTTLVAPPEGDMLDYMATLERLQALDARIIAPGHGPIVESPREKFDEYIGHRRAREAQLLQILAKGPKTVTELVTEAYADVDPRLHGLARGSVEAQLIKLLKEGRLTVEGPRYRA